MGRIDWDYIQVSKGMSKALDDFCKSPEAEELGVSNKHVLVRMLVTGFLKDYRKIYKVVTEPRLAAEEEIRQSDQPKIGTSPPPQ